MTLSLGIGLGITQQRGGKPELLTAANAVESGVNATTGWLGADLDVFQSQAGVTNGSDFAFEINSNTLAISAARVYRELFNLGTMVVGITYRLYIDARHLGSGGDWSIYIANNNSGNDTLIKRLTSTDTTFVTYTVDFVYGATQDNIVVRETSATNDGGVYIDNVSLKAL